MSAPSSMVMNGTLWVISPDTKFTSPLSLRGSLDGTG